MKNRSLIKAIVIILIFTIMIITLSACTNRNISEGIAFRSYNEINSEKVIYLDDEAIALADMSNVNVSLRSEAIKAFNLVNDKRITSGIKPLEWDQNLETTSIIRAEEASVSFSHIRPNGKVWYSINSQIQGGENLAWGYENAGDALKAWINSPTHKENILCPEFKSIAISIYVTDDGIYYWAQEFGY